MRLMRSVSSSFSFFVVYPLELSGRYFLIFSEMQLHGIRVLEIRSKEVDLSFAGRLPYVFSNLSIEDVEILCLVLFELLLYPPCLGDCSHVAYSVLPRDFIQEFQVGKN